MPTVTNPDATLRRRWPRLLVAAGALAAALWTLGAWSASQRDRARLLRQAGELGVPAAALEKLEPALARESDRGERRLVAARALLAAAITAGDEDPERAAGQLEAARDLAREALVDLPASWEGAMLEGAATALLRIQRRDTHLFTAYREWEAPLELAHARAPGAAEPGRYLAAAYLEVWPALSPEKRKKVEPLLRDAFTDEFFFSRMFDRWVTIAGSPEKAAALLPDAAPTWRRLFEVAASRGELDAAARLYLRARDALRDELERRLRDGARDGAVDRTRLSTEVVTRAPIDLAFVPLVERAIAARPPGPVPPALATAAQRWVEWAQPLCLLRDCPLSPETFGRMASSAGAGLPPDRAAFAALAAGDLPRADLLARRSDSLWSENWGPYLLLAAKRHLAHGDLVEGCGELAQVHRLLRPGPAYRLLARSCGPGAEPAGLEDPRPLARADWQAADWSWSQGIPSLALVAVRPAEALELTLRERASQPSMLLVQWDGAELAPLLLPAGAERLVVRTAVAAGPHLLRISAVVGPPPTPGTTALR